ncbi:MAG: S-layer homology domain-containing protein [Candidatus Absconditabacterales bacterium]
MNKKLFGIFFIVAALLLAFPTKAETTGNANTGANIQGDCHPVISGLVISIICTTGNVTTGMINTGTVNTGTTNNTGQNTMSGGLSTGSEFEQALAWMYANGLTKYSSEIDYRANDGLTREEAAKIVGQAFIKLGYNQETKNTNCIFIDTSKIDPSLSGFVTNACKRGIFKGTTDNKFLPTQKLTRPQAMALLVRIFEGKISNESRIPRWGDYYIKGQALGLTTLNNQTAFDSDITRKEIAIYIFRFKNIVTNDTIRLMLLNKLTEFEATGQDFNSGMLDDFGSLADSLSINNDPELIEAIRWMNDNGLTNFKTIPEYKPFEILNREQAAKIVSLFANIYNFNENTGGALPSSCIFKDISDADESLTTYVENVCTLGVMQGSNGYFNPKGTINKSQFIASIIRLFEGKKLDENVSPRWKNYFEKAQEIGMIGPADAVTFENPITRYEVALFLYRFKVKYQILKNINNNTIQNQIVSTVPGSIRTGLNNMPESNVYVDMNLLQNGNFDVGYLELFGQRYKVVKSNTKEYGPNMFVRYGDIFSLDKEEKIGTTSFIVSNFSLIEGTIRIQYSTLTGDATFAINPISNTNAYYKINKTK